MKRIITKSISNLCSLSSSLLKWQDNCGLRILNYHSIGGSAYKDKRGYFSISTNLFKNHIDYIHSVYSVISLKEVKISKRKLDLAITFDDGYLDNLKIAAPILLDKELPFTVFVSTSFVRDRVKNFLSPADLKELSKLPGVTIGSHGLNHLNLTNVPREIQIKELRDSKLYLEDIIGQKVNSFAYPYGKFSNSIAQLLEDYSYESAFTTRFDLNISDSNRFKLARFNIEFDNSIKILTQKINGDWDWYQYRDWVSNFLRF